MISTAVLTDGVENEAGSFAAEYEDVTFIFETAEERTLWLQNTTPDDIEYIITAARMED